MKIRYFAGLLVVAAFACVATQVSAQESEPEQPAPAVDVDIPVMAAENADSATPPVGPGDGTAAADQAPAPQSEQPPETEQPATEGAVAGNQGPSDDDISRARDLAGEGSAFYAEGQYAKAIVKFRAALELYRHPVIYFNLAKAYEKEADYEQAADAYREYLRLHQEQTGAPAPDQKDTEQTIALLAEKSYLALPEVTIDSDPRGAEVYIDGADVLNGQTPMVIHLVEGKHSLLIRMEGYQSIERDFEIRSRDPSRFTFSMTQERISGGILVTANVRGARIHIDGNVVGVTPMLQPFDAKPGRHQVMVEKDDYTQYAAIVEVMADQVSEVAVSIHLARKTFSWRGSLGITSMIIGAGVVGASAWGRYYINDGYKDKGMYNVVVPNAVDAPPFETYKSMVYAGYGVGAGLAALGLGLLIWEVARKPLEIKPEDRIEQVKPSVTIVPAFGQDSVGIGAVATF